MEGKPVFFIVDNWRAQRSLQVREQLIGCLRCTICIRPKKDYIILQQIKCILNKQCIYHPALCCSKLQSAHKHKERKTSAECWCCIHGAGERMLECALFVVVFSLETHNYHLRENQPELSALKFPCKTSLWQQITQGHAAKPQQGFCP